MQRAANTHKGPMRWTWALGNFEVGRTGYGGTTSRYLPALASLAQVVDTSRILCVSSSTGWTTFEETWDTNGVGLRTSHHMSMQRIARNTHTRHNTPCFVLLFCSAPYDSVRAACNQCSACNRGHEASVATRIDDLLASRGAPSLRSQCDTTTHTKPAKLCNLPLCSCCHGHVGKLGTRRGTRKKRNRSSGTGY